MDPIAFTIPIMDGLDIRWYGIMMACSMLVGAFIASRLLTRCGRDGEAVWDGLFWIILAGVVGARLIYVVTNLGLYAANPWKVFFVWEGGLSFHGGIIGGLIASYLYFQSREIPFVEVMDSFAPGISVGIILVRFGNFMNGDILGYQWAGPWAMNFPHDQYHVAQQGVTILRHPTEIYGMAVGLFCLICAMIMWNETYLNKRWPTGTAFMGFILVYSLTRSLIEDPFRNVPLPWKVVDPEVAGYGLFTYAQLVSILLIIVALWGFTQLRRWERLRAQAKQVTKRSGDTRQRRRAAERQAKKK